VPDQLPNRTKEDLPHIISLLVAFSFLTEAKKKTRSKNFWLNCKVKVLTREIGLLRISIMLNVAKYYT